MSLIRKHSVKITVVAATTGIFILKYILSKYRDRKEDKCFVIQSAGDWNAHEDEILIEFKQSGFIGMDCEWVMDGNNRKPVSLLQLANYKGFCVLIRLSKIPVWMIPAGLSELLSDGSILKVGVGVGDDASKLFHDYCLEVSGYIDLRYLVKDLPELQGKSFGLKSMAKELLKYNLNKSDTLRCSNWDADSLNSSQIRYAADDAIVSARLFETVKSKNVGWFSSFSKFYKEIELYVDFPFKQTSSNNSGNKSAQVQPVLRNKLRYSKPRQKPMYDNCRLVAPDGEVLCNCDRRKAEWYVYKGLGETICEQPYTVRLNFEPSGRPKLDNIFYTLEKFNCCAVCGKTEKYHRKLVVPSEYRKYFPELMKKSLSHDVLLLCVECHKKSNIIDREMRKKLAELCDAPLIDSKHSKYKLNKEMVYVKSAASALSRFGHEIPECRKEVLENTIKNYFSASEVTDELIEKALNLDVSILNESFVPHGLKVYQYFCSNGGLFKLEKMWRQHFLDTMQPKYLPDMWSVDHNHKRLALQVINNEREVNFDISILGLDSDLIKEVKSIENKSV